MIPMLMHMMKFMRDLRAKIGVLQLPLFKDILTEEVMVKVLVSTQ